MYEYIYIYIYIYEYIYIYIYIHIYIYIYIYIYEEEAIQKMRIFIAEYSVDVKRFVSFIKSSSGKR